MDYDVDALRERVAAIDEQHHEGMRTMASDVRELHAENRKALGGTSRREFLIRSGLTAAAVTIGSATLPLSSLWSPAFGQTLDDDAIAAFAASVEYAAVAAYTAAAGTGKVTGPVLDTAKVFLSHHQQHGDAFAGASNGKATKNPNKTLVDMLGPQITAAPDQNAILTIAFAVENAAAATYLYSLQHVKSDAAMKLSASILPIEAGHAVVLGTVLGYKAADDTNKSKELRYLPPFQTLDGALDPTKYPA